MPTNLYSLNTKRKAVSGFLTQAEVDSVIYHDIFDFPLSLSDIVRWKAGVSLGGEPTSIVERNGFFLKEGKETSVYQRILRDRVSVRKLEIAKRAARLLSPFFGIKMVGITGSLAMKNAAEGSDIDLIIVTKKNFLWATRLTIYGVILITGFGFRRWGKGELRDKLCLNIWLDESDLSWSRSERNIYSAHEIAQILPLVDKDNTYQEFLSKNKWVLKFWPNAVKIEKSKIKKLAEPNRILGFINLLAYKVQRWYMRLKITREVVTPTRALFHPVDWGGVVLARFKNV